MKVGAVYPQIELNGDPVALDQITRAVEAQGYDHIVLYDHVVGADRSVKRDPPLWELGPYSDKDPFHEPMVAFGYMAGITKRIEFINGILILPQRQTVLAAKQIAELDLLSGGRLHVGVGTGWNYVEYVSLNEDFESRGARLDEQLDVMRMLWEQPLVTFKGKFHTIDRANILPRPKRRIPVYAGGFAEPALRRAAKKADGFIFASALDHVVPVWSRLQQLLDAEGRSKSDFRAQYLLQNADVSGMKPADAVDAIRRWEDLGGTHASVVSMGQGMKSSTQHVDYFADVAARLNLKDS